VSGSQGLAIDAQQAAQAIRELEHASRIVRVPAGTGAMQWRTWGRGRPLVLFHGGGGTWLHWIRTIPTLAASRQVWAADLPGFGASDDPRDPREARSVAQAAAEGLLALRAQGEFGALAGEGATAGEVDLVGFSFGGIIAGLVAAALPGFVSRLVIVGATGLGVSAPELGLKPWRDAPDDAERAALHRHNLRALMLAFHRDDDALAPMIHADGLAKARVNGRFAARSLLLRDALARVAAPVSGIWGEQDATAAPDVARVGEAIRAVRPDAGFHVIERSGHWVQYEAPDAFIRYLQQALAHPGR
jgi:pimeloyl-ACP methyl ester carboxylesterase